MKITLEFTKREMDLLMRGMRYLLIDENERSDRNGNGGWVPTKNYLAAEALEARLIEALAGMNGGQK